MTLTLALTLTLTLTLTLELTLTLALTLSLTLTLTLALALSLELKLSLALTHHPGTDSGRHPLLLMPYHKSNRVVTGRLHACHYDCAAHHLNRRQRQNVRVL